MFNFNLCCFCIFSILTTAPVYANEETNNDKKSNPNDDYNQDIIRIFDALEESINEKFKKDRTNRKKADELINEAFKKNDERCSKAAQEIEAIQKRQDVMQKRQDAMQNRQEQCATKEWVRKSLDKATSKIDEKLAELIDEKLAELPPFEQVATKKWVNQTINETYNPLNQELKAHKEWLNELSAKTKELSLAQKKPSYDESLSVQEYVDASLKKHQQDLAKLENHYNNNNSWSTRDSTIGYIWQHKTGFALCGMLLYHLVSAAINFSPSNKAPEDASKGQAEQPVAPDNQ